MSSSASSSRPPRRAPPRRRRVPATRPGRAVRRRCRRGDPPAGRRLARAISARSTTWTCPTSGTRPGWPCGCRWPTRTCVPSSSRTPCASSVSSWRRWTGRTPTLPPHDLRRDHPGLGEGPVRGTRGAWPWPSWGNAGSTSARGRTWSPIPRSEAGSNRSTSTRTARVASPGGGPGRISPPADARRDRPEDGREPPARAGEAERTLIFAGPPGAHRRTPPMETLASNPHPHLGTGASGACCSGRRNGPTTTVGSAEDPAAEPYYRAAGRLYVDDAVRYGLARTPARGAGAVGLAKPSGLRLTGPVEPRRHQRASDRRRVPTAAGPGFRGHARRSRRLAGCGEGPPAPAAVVIQTARPPGRGRGRSPIACILDRPSPEPRGRSPLPRSGWSGRRWRPTACIAANPSRSPRPSRSTRGRTSSWDAIRSRPSGASPCAEKEIFDRFGNSDGAVAIVLDCSGSMGASPGQAWGPTVKYQEATDAPRPRARQAQPGHDGERLGLRRGDRPREDGPGRQSDHPADPTSSRLGPGAVRDAHGTPATTRPWSPGTSRRSCGPCSWPATT